MGKQLLLAVVAIAAGTCFAQDLGRVISSTPVLQQVAVPRQVCTTEPSTFQPPKSGAGAVAGAIAGGVLGNAIGSGSGQVAATMLGIFGGAVVGDRLEAPPPAQVQNVQRCWTQTFYENRAVSYDVVYEYAGKQYSVQMPNDPGPTVRLQITAVDSVAQTPAPAPVIVEAYSQPVIVQPPGVVLAAPGYPGYPGYYPYSYVPPVSIGLGFGYWGGYRGGYRGHPYRR